ncbi:Gp15 family bacteriophage protein [Listeria monocytogenes]|uniref:Gp15 family bacteriophage protein n=1 Tax=Listeria TaxID=1637 RepID=UPI001908D112|nr:MULTISPECIES: Gp15 family bacteriophage protein [Listeria]MBK1965094.1 bacteriophage Gp15 family protein [Listeria ivanovii subsp. londoniensis]WDE53491.1 Gp15 family bacteriophage protein [Listeria monocytogenes]HEM1440030.1 bacteriophage Gp15 family protein [Listeria monocytogenes]
MLSLADGIESTYTYNNVDYLLDLSFDNVLRVLELNANTQLTDDFRINLAIDVLFDNEMPWARFDEENPLLNIEEKAKVLFDIFENYIVKNNNEGIQYDIEGNKMPVATNDTESNDSCLSLTQDSDYIFASFLQDYNIDLIDMRGKLHWDKFRALLNSLRDDTAIKSIMNIRQVELPTGKGSEKEREALIKLKNHYRLNG